MILKLKKSDFLMAKRLKQRLARENKDRAGCMSGIVHIFDFRHGRVTRRLLSDHRTHMTEIITGPSYPTSEVNSLTDSEEMHQRNESPNDEKSEMAQTRVKELMEEEIQCDQTEKTSSRSFNTMEISIDQQVPSQKPSEYCDLEDLVNNLLLIHQRRRTEEQNPKSLERSNSLDNEQRVPSSEEPVSHKNRKFFRRRSKSHECILLNDNDTPPPSKTPNRFHHERSLSHFSFTEIKKKLKNVIRRCPRDSGCPEKPVFDGNIGWSSPNRDCFYSERFSRISNGFKRQDDISWLGKSERKLGKNDAFGDTSERISNIYIEAKKHLSEMLNNDDEETELTAESTSRSLGKLLSFPGYNSRSSGICPRNKPENGAVTMSPSRNSPVVKESQPPVTDDNYQEPEVLDEILQAEDVEVIKRPLSAEEVEVLDVVDKSEEDELSSSPPATPSGSSLAFNRKAEEAESTLDDRTGKPSPVSVLEPLFSDDDISPARTIKRSAESSIQPLRIRFEEMASPARNQEPCTPHLVENEESAFEYVEAVLLASDLSWDDFEKRWLSSDQIIESSLYNELQIFSNLPDHEQQLLFDATNEIIKEVCDWSLGFLSYPKMTSIHMLPKGMDLINEVWERIESRLHQHYSRSLDQLIKKDLDVPRSWMDLCPETEDIVMETAESIFEDVIDDTVLSLMQHDSLKMIK